MTEAEDEAFKVAITGARKEMAKELLALLAKGDVNGVLVILRKEAGV
jgi:hypothetical protein